MARLITNAVEANEVIYKSENIGKQKETIQSLLDLISNNLDEHIKSMCAMREKFEPVLQPAPCCDVSKDKEKACVDNSIMNQLRFVLDKIREANSVCSDMYERNQIN